MTLDFQSYLASIRMTYAKWWEYFTLTDATGKQRQLREASPFFDFGLTVQTVKREERDRQTEEKVERFSVLDGLRKYADQQVLLVGRPGSGKSTALARLMLEEATNQQARIPVLVELRYWQGSIEQLIYDSLIRHEMPAEQIEAALKNALILFDGVNELPSEEARSQLSAFRRNHPKLPMIFTTRDLSIGGNLGIEKKLEMQPLTENQMREFVRSYLPDQAEQMSGQLKDRLRDLGQTPLLLWMLCSLFQQTGKIPENLGLVFREFTQGYERFLKDDVRIESDKAWWKPVLQQLAWVMMQGEKPTEFRVAIKLEEAVGAIAQFLDEKIPYAEDFARKCLRDLQKHHLLQAGTAQEELEFRHQLIQEYYAAEALLEQLPKLEDEPLKQEFLNFLKWTEPVAMMLALVDEAQAEQVIGLALQVDCRMGSRFAGAVKPEFQKKTVGFVEELKVPEWLKVQCLGEMRSESAIPGLLERLEDADSLVRGRAADALGKIGSEATIPGLLERLEDADSLVRRRAADALGKIGSEAAIPGLLERLEDADSFVRGRAADALGEIGNEAAILGLLERLEDADSFVRKRAADALGKIGSEAAILELLERLEDADSLVRGRAADALGKIGSEAAIPGLLERLEDASLEVCVKAAFALGDIGSEATIPGLLERLEDADSLVRWLAAFALGKIGSEAAIPGLLERLEDVDSFVRKRAAFALGKIGSEATIPGLLERLEDVDSDVRWLVAFALGDIGSEATIPGLLERLEDAEFDVRGRAADALGEIGNEAAILGLLERLEHADSDVRKRAADALGKIGSEATIPGLLERLEDPDSLVRGRAADALGEIGSEAAILGLLERLEHADSDVRERATFALCSTTEKHAETITQHLPHLLTLIPTDSGENASLVIRATQRNYKYYNYEIYQAYLEAQKHDLQTPQNSDRSNITYDLRGATIGNLAHEVQGNQITQPEEPQ